MNSKETKHKIDEHFRAYLKDHEEEPSVTWGTIATQLNDQSSTPKRYYLKYIVAISFCLCLVLLWWGGDSWYINLTEQPKSAQSHVTPNQNTDTSNALNIKPLKKDISQEQPVATDYIILKQPKLSPAKIIENASKLKTSEPKDLRQNDLQPKSNNLIEETYTKPKEIPQSLEQNEDQPANNLVPEPKQVPKPILASQEVPSRLVPQPTQRSKKWLKAMVFGLKQLPGVSSEVEAHSERTVYKIQTGFVKLEHSDYHRSSSNFKFANNSN